MSSAPNNRSPAPDLTAADLATVVPACHRVLAGGTVEDVSLFRDRDDLQLVLKGADGRRHRLLLALGRGRARMGTTTRRFAREDFATGPRVDGLVAALMGRTIAQVATVPGDRQAHIAFDDGGTLHVEFFGTRGLWVLVNAQGVVEELSRTVAQRQRSVRRGAPWEPVAADPPRKKLAPSTRFWASEPESVLAAVDVYFTEVDEQAEADRRAAVLHRAVTRAQKKLEHQRDGMAARLDAGQQAPALRARADLMLAYAHGVPRGASSMEVPALDGNGTETLPLDPARPVHEQAKALYAKIRKLVDGAAETRTRRDRLQEQLDGLTRAGDDPEAQMLWLQSIGEGRGLIENRPAQAERKAGIRGGAARPSTPRGKGTAGKDDRDLFRRYRSAEGYPILCGRNNKENDRLSVRTAKGNDLWLHIGRQVAGSHVVVRLPKGKTPSLETLLDAAHIAVHFSKSRGTTTAEVIYTQAKHVRKPKGLPPGAVLPQHTKTISVRMDSDRLQRILDSGAPT